MHSYRPFFRPGLFGSIAPGDFCEWTPFAAIGRVSTSESITIVSRVIEFNFLKSKSMHIYGSFELLVVLAVLAIMLR